LNRRTTRTRPAKILDLTAPAAEVPWRAIAIEIAMTRLGALGPKSTSFVLSLVEAEAIGPKRKGRLLRLAKRLGVQTDAPA
jgi:hypothetical protein